MKDAVTKSWFAVLNNPAEHGYAGTPEEVCSRLRDEWLIGGTERTGAWAKSLLRFSGWAAARTYGS